MKTMRNFTFVLTCIDNSSIETGEITINNSELTGEVMFKSECHYYAEKDLISAVKDAEKNGLLSDFYNHTYLIYKQYKPKKVTEERQEGNKKIVETTVIPGEVQLIEKITIDENGINIQ